MVNVNEYFTLVVPILTKNDFLKNCKTNDSSCIDIYSSIDKVKLLNTTWLCVKCKYTR